MDVRETTPSEEIPEISVDTVRPLIESFFTRVMPEQWTLLRSSKPDEATKIMLAELLLEFISRISKALLLVLKNLNVVTEKHALSAMGTIISQIFNEYLVAESPCFSSEPLTKLIVKEITESVNSILSSRVGSKEPLLGKGTPPCRLNAMVLHACSILRTCTTEVKLFCNPPHRQRNQYNSKEDVDTEDKFDQEKESSARSEVPDASVTAISQTLQEIIYKELNKITDPLLDNMSDLEYKLLTYKSFLEMKTFADDIAKLIAKTVEKLKTRNFASTSPTFKKEYMKKKKIVGNKMKIFLAKQFTKASIIRIVAQLTTKFKLESKEGSKEKMQSLMDSVDSLLLTETAGENEMNVFWKFKHISSGKIPDFTQTLIDLLYSHITQSKTSWISPETIRMKIEKMPIPQSDAPLYTAVRNKVQCFLGLTSWWLNTEASNSSEKVTRVLMDPASLSTIQLPEDISVKEVGPASGDVESVSLQKVICVVPANVEVLAEPVCEQMRADPVQDTTAKTETLKMSVMTLVDKLVKRTFRKAKEDSTSVKLEAITVHLFDKTWVQIKEIDFDISQKTSKNLDKTIFKELCKKYDCVEMLLESMKSRKPEIEKCIISSLKHYATQPKRHSTISRFFSSVGKAISNVFRWRNRV